MSRLNEKYVQKIALSYLNQYYLSKFNCKSGFARKEVRTKKNKRADGLLCFCTDKHSSHTVSIEAKSHKTLNSLLPFWDDNKLGIHFFLTALLVTAGVIYIVNDFQWYWILLAAVASFFLAAVLYIFIVTFLEPKGYKSLNVINQLRNYPANEQWVAISVDSFNLTSLKENLFHNKTNAEILVSQCRRNGIGLLLVNKRQAKIEIYPKYKKGKFLSNYCIEKDIRSVLEEVDAVSEASSV